MADTLSQFETRFRRYVKELNPDTSFWTTAFFQQLFNSAYRRRCTQLIMAFEGWFTSVSLRDIEADKGRYAWPEGFQRLRKLELVRTDGKTIPVQRWERHAETNFDNSSIGSGDQYMPTYRPLGNGFVLEPAPNATVINGLRLESEGVPAFLDGADDKLHPSFPEILDELVILDTVVAAMQAEGVHEQGPVAAIYRIREEWDWDWNRFIDQRVVARSEVSPFVPHYHDA